MTRVLLTAMASFGMLILPAGPAQAQHNEGTGMRSHHPGWPTHGRDMGPCQVDGQRTGRDARVRCSTFGGGWAYADGQWALYNNQSWGPDSFNDWWNDRPDRAYPRWVQEQRRQGTCEPDRMWWSGSGWHC